MNSELSESALRQASLQGQLFLGETVLAEIFPAIGDADRLLARDRGYLRDYFKDLKVMDPSIAG